MLRAFLLLSFALTSYTSSAWQALDATRYRTFHPYMGTPIKVVYEGDILPAGDNSNRAPIESEIKAKLAPLRGSPIVVIDIESWYLLKNQVLVTNAARNAGWYLQVLTWARQVLPGTKIGFFGLPASARYAYKWPSTFMVDYKKSVSLLSPVLSQVDAIFPEFYMWFKGSDVPNFQAVTLYVAKEFNKPIIPFMWHRDPLTETYLSNADITNQCSWLKANSDGVAWWSKWVEVYEPTSTWYSAAKSCFN